MARYVRVNKAPEDLRKDEYIIPAPTFLTEVKACEGKRPRNGTMTRNYIREIVAQVGGRYIGDDFDALRVNISRYRGVGFTDHNSVNDITIKLFSREMPMIFDAYVDYWIKQRPNGCKLIYFEGDHLFTRSFTQNGIDEIKEKDVPAYLGIKSKKTVGKPAVKDAPKATSGDENTV